MNCFFFQAEDGIRDGTVTGVQTCALPIFITAILRVDPRSPSVTRGVKGLGDYTIPMANKFAADGDPNTLGEIYARSEERRVGKECRSRMSSNQQKGNR